MRERIGPYRIQRELGRGGMGVVYAAVDPAGREVALKVLPTRGADPARLERFKLECEALGRLSHPNVIGVHSAGEADGYVFYTMALVAGGSLAERVAQRGPLGPAATVALGIALCDALEAAHGIGVLHRDLKPENVLFGPQDQPLLADFGLARSMLADAELTRSGAFLGTPGYMAPEQARGDRHGQGSPTDVYGLGGTLYFALTGQPPIQGESLAQLLLNTQEQSPQRPSKLNPAVPPGLDAVCLRCLSKDPQQRFPTPAALRGALAAALAAGGTGRGRRGMLAAGAASLLALAAVLVAHFASGPRAQRSPDAGSPAPSMDAAPGSQATNDALEGGEVPRPRGYGPVPWERAGLPELALNAAEAIRAGREARVAGDWALAAQMFEHAKRRGAERGVEFAAEYAEVASARMQELQYAGWWDEAVQWARRISAVADPHCERESFDLEQLARAGRFQLPYANAHFVLAEVHCEARRYPEALAELVRVGRATPDSGRLHHLAAKAYLGQGDLESAAREVQACCLEPPRDDPSTGHLPEARMAYAEALLARGDVEGARPHLEFARGAVSEFHRFRAGCLLDPAGQTKAAELVASYDPRGLEPELHLRAAAAFWRLDRWEGAERAGVRATRLAPRSARAWAQLAAYRVQRGWGGAAAVEAAQRLQALPGQRALGLAYAACGYGMEARYEEAAAAGREALALEPGLILTTPLGQALGRALVEVGELAEAERVEGLLRAGPTYRQAQAQELFGFIDRARRE
ncbi:MAG: protein kinase [Planctomycetes bacterium]|nr:protein kinase [Planctomycetota bacterium]